MSSDCDKEAKQSKLCVVCGDTALGCNFGALTCESCKAFFRRNGLKSDKLLCLFDNNCNIDKNTRRFCTFCRLRKCQQVGMKKEFILGEDEKRLRHEKARIKLEKKILKRRKQDELDALKNKYLVKATKLDSLSLNSFETQHFQNNMTPPPASLISDLPNALEQCSYKSDKKEGNPLLDLLDFTDDLSDFLISHSETNSYHQQSSSLLSQTAIHHSDIKNDSTENKSANQNPPSFSAYKQICLNETLSKFGQCRILTTEQWSAINSLRVAYEKSFYSTVCEENPAGATSINHFVNKSGSIVKKMITFAKEFSQFSNLNQDNQIALLRGVVGHTLLVISATHYDVENNLWKTPEGRIPARILTVVSQFNGLYEEHAQYCRLFRAWVGHDIQIIASMLVLCLFSPDSISLGERDQVSRTHDYFVLLLKHYLEAQYGYRESRAKLPGVLDCLCKMQKIVDNHSKVLFYVDPSQTDPLMLEILNIQENRKLVAIQNGLDFHEDIHFVQS